MSSSTGNQKLADVMGQAGVSNKGLAALIRLEANRRGLNIAPDHISVRRWLDGVTPRADTAECIAAALSTKVGRNLVVSDLGFLSSAKESPPGDLSPLTVRNGALSLAPMERLATADLDNDPRVSQLEWSADANPELITRYLFAGSPSEWQPLAAEKNPADRIRSTLRRLADLDFEFGGGHARSMVLFFWRTEILPLLRTKLPEHKRQLILSAGADAAQLLGWSAYDAGRHGAAQRYFSYGLTLAKEANDPLMGAQILSNLSHQANYLGRFDHAVQLARASQSAMAGIQSNTVQSMLYAMEARALANLGERRECQRIINLAESTFDRRTPQDDPDWIWYFDEFELAGEGAHCFRDLGEPTQMQNFVVQAIDQTATPSRTRAFIVMVDAAGCLKAGNLDEALSKATSAFQIADSLDSSRYSQYVADFRRALRRDYSQHSSVIAYEELLRSTNPSEGTPL